MMDPDSNNGKIVKMVLGGDAGVQVLQKETGEIVAGSASLATPAESSFAQPSNFLSHGPVMTDEQLETLRRQISVYATICNQLVEMHKASMVHQAVLPSIISGQNPLYDPAYSSRSTGRQRWTPSQSQLQILENLFEKGSGTPNKQKIKEITAQLNQHGQISETNVYNWFQNRKARAKRKQQSVTQKDVDSEADTDEVESPKEKKATLVRELSLDNQDSGKTPVNNLSIEENLGLVDQKRPHRSSQHDRSQCNAFSALLHPEVDSEVDKGSNSRPKREVNHENMSTHGSQSSFGTMIVLIDGKRWEVPSGALDLKGSFGESAVLLDSRRNIIPTDEIGFTFHPLNANESYTLARLSDVMGEIVSQSRTLHSYQGVDHSKKGFVNNPGLH